MNILKKALEEIEQKIEIGERLLWWHATTIRVAIDEIDTLRARIAELEGNAKPAIIVPISDTDLSLEACNADPGDWNSLHYKDCWHEGYKVGFRDAESYHSERISKAPPAPMVPDGWKLVPVEPTKDMMRAFWLAGPYPEKPWRDGYSAMLAAAPEPKPCT